VNAQRAHLRLSQVGAWIAAAIVLLAPARGSGNARAQDSERIFKAALLYTVQIETSVEVPMHPDDERGVFTGAGFLVDMTRGWIMTNVHVVSHSPARIRVIRKGGASAPGHRVWLDPYLDLALLQVDDRKFLAGLHAASLACDGFPSVGHPVGAFGHPWGLPWTGTRGIISGRSDAYEPGALLTDAPINSGNSGGPLVSLRTGEVVGINTAALEGEGIQNLNFALAIKYACRVLRLLQEGRDPSPPSNLLVFVSGSEDEPLKVARNYLPIGAIDLRPGDIIQDVAGEQGPVATEADFMDAVRGRLDHVQLDVERGPVDVVVSGRFPPAENLLKRRAVVASGLTFGRTHPYDSREVNFGSVAACNVETGSAGQAAGVEKCDVVESVDGQPIHELATLYEALHKAQQEGQPGLLELKRLVGPKGRSFFSYIGVELPVEGLHWIAPTDP
jgi:S1-C subfamily serine protease